MLNCPTGRHPHSSSSTARVRWPPDRQTTNRWPRSGSPPDSCSSVRQSPKFFAVQRPAIRLVVDASTHPGHDRAVTEHHCPSAMLGDLRESARDQQTARGYRDIEQFPVHAPNRGQLKVPTRATMSYPQARQRHGYGGASFPPEKGRGSGPGASRSCFCGVPPPGSGEMIRGRHCIGAEPGGWTSTWASSDW